jgi:hypothetical protein
VKGRICAPWPRPSATFSSYPPDVAVAAFDLMKKVAIANLPPSQSAEDNGRRQSELGSSSNIFTNAARGSLGLVPIQELVPSAGDDSGV